MNKLNEITIRINQNLHQQLCQTRQQAINHYHRHVKSKKKKKTRSSPSSPLARPPSSTSTRSSTSARSTTSSKTKSRVSSSPLSPAEHKKLVLQHRTQHPFNNTFPFHQILLCESITHKSKRDFTARTDDLIKGASGGKPQSLTLQIMPSGACMISSSVKRASSTIHVDTQRRTYHTSDAWLSQAESPSKHLNCRDRLFFGALRGGTYYYESNTIKVGPSTKNKVVAALPTEKHFLFLRGYNGAVLKFRITPP
mmetsp:Transcript_422/g.774  ORF Transcript_422/g.774 Transcript_422/m.774 type:complete len:253 (-) Transcript_422:37-795(-)